MAHAHEQHVSVQDINRQNQRLRTILPQYLQLYQQLDHESTFLGLEEPGVVSFLSLLILRRLGRVRRQVVLERIRLLDLPHDHVVLLGELVLVYFFGLVGFGGIIILTLFIILLYYLVLRLWHADLRLDAGASPALHHNLSVLLFARRLLHLID